MADSKGIFVRKIGGMYLAAANDSVSVMDDTVTIFGSWADVETVFDEPIAKHVRIWLTAFATEGQLIATIKVVREYGGLDLVQAKTLVEAMKGGAQKQGFLLAPPTVVGFPTMSLEDKKAVALKCIADLKEKGCTAEMEELS